MVRALAIHPGRPEYSWSSSVSSRRVTMLVEEVIFPRLISSPLVSRVRRVIGSTRRVPRIVNNIITRSISA